LLDVFEVITRTSARDTYRHTPPPPGMQTGGVAENHVRPLLSGPAMSMHSASERPRVPASGSGTIETSGKSNQAVQESTSLDGRVGASFGVITIEPCILPVS
jgi:hypothetical protein